MSQPVLIIGGFFAIPYIFYAVIQTARRRSEITGFGTLLACAAVIVPVGLLAYQTVQGTSEPTLVAVAIASAGIVALFSIVILIRDLLRKPRDLNQSYGPLGIGVAFLLIAGMITTPSILALFPNAISTPTVAAASNTNSANSALVDVLTAETGLDAPTILAQVSGGKTIADLVIGAQRRHHQSDDRARQRAARHGCYASADSYAARRRCDHCRHPDRSRAGRADR